MKRFKLIGAGGTARDDETPPFSWDSCIICQDTTKREPLQCPNSTKRCDKGAGYKSLASMLTKFNEIGELPSYVRFPALDDGDGIETTLAVHNAKWHKTCRDAFNATKFERAQRRKIASTHNQQKQMEQDQSPCTSKEHFTRSVNVLSCAGTPDKPCCFFCDESGDLHEASTFSLDSRVRNCAYILQDSRLLAKLGSHDMIALEAKYHSSCLVSLYNRARDACNQDNANDTQSDMCSDSIAFAQLVEYIEEVHSNSQQTSVFVLSDLVQKYQLRLDQMGIKLENRVNTTRFKERLLSHFPHMKAQTHGKQVLLVCDSDIGSAVATVCQYDRDVEALHLARAAQVVRRDLIKVCNSFKGSFSTDCQADSVPASLTTLIDMILMGPSIENQSDSMCTQSAVSVSQLIAFNTVKNTRRQSHPAARSRHNVSLETPLPLYIAMKIHAETRKRELIDAFFSLGLCVSYDRMLQVSAALGNRVCNMYELNRGPCPPTMKKGLFTTAAVDNIDHNPSSTSARGSFHGTAITLTQHRNEILEGEPMDCVAGLLDIGSDSKSIKSLPGSYTTVPSVKPLNKSVLVPSADFAKPADDLHQIALAVEYEWLETVRTAAACDTNGGRKDLSWAGFHANLQTKTICPDITTLLPLFPDAAHSAAMISHAMNIVKKSTDVVNPGQVPVIEVDQPLFAIAKQIQWNWPDSFGEGQLVVLLGGLHTEMAALRVLGAWLDGSGWTAALVNANIVSSGKADALLQASHVTRARYCHQVTVASLYILQQRAYAASVDSSDNVTDDGFHTWCSSESQKRPQFMYWSQTMALQLAVLLLVRSIRESNFDLYVCSLSEIIPWFFALDRHHYARWGAVHLRDMLMLPVKHPEIAEQFVSGRFTVNRTKRPFSSIACDHAHEQMNAHVKGVGGIIGLTENTQALLRWMVAGPEVARVIAEFELAVWPEYDCDIGGHHEQTASVQQQFMQDVVCLTDSIESMGNPFLDDSDELFALDTKVVLHAKAVGDIRSAKQIGVEQHNLFVSERLVDRTKPVSEPIKQNNFKMFKQSRNVRKMGNKGKLTAARNDCSLFSRLFIACQVRDGDLDDFFQHENQSCPPALSCDGKLRYCNKSDLLGCLEKLVPSQQEPPSVSTLVIDGAALVNMLAPQQCKTFDDYAVKIFLPHISAKLKQVRRLDLVWDQYLQHSLKSMTRDKRGLGVRRRVVPSALLPRSWSDFLRVPDNKTELFTFLSGYVAGMPIDTGKEVIVTDGCNAMYNPNAEHASMLEPCSHEEADTRVMLHIAHAVSKGHTSLMIRTVDTDVVVIAVSCFHRLPSVQLWVAFGVGKSYRYLAIHELASALGTDRCKAIAFFHAFSGCDTVSSFAGNGKKRAFDTWQAFPEVTDAFAMLSSEPDSVAASMPLLERFVVLLYDRSSSKTAVNAARKQLFTKKGRSMEYLPPTEAALSQHVKRAAYQSGYVWYRSLQPQQELPSPELWGWIREDEPSEWQPLWTTMPDVTQSCSELVSCKCKKGCTKRCKCVKAALECTALCQCDGNCTRGKT